MPKNNKSSESRPVRFQWLRIIKPSSRVAQVMIVLALGVVLYAAYHGYLDRFRELLSDERYAFSIGAYELTAYAVLRDFFIIILLFWIAAFISGIGEKRIGRMHHLRRSTQLLLIKLFQILVYVIAFLIGLDLMGIQLTTMTVFSGALGIGIGFGLQKITSNFISGIILLSEKTIEQDDLIELPDGTSGVVRRIGARFTLMELADGRDILIPNEDFITRQVVNWTYSNKRARAEIDIGVAYDSDLDRVRDIMLDCARAHPRSLSSPAPTCQLMGFGENAVNFRMHFWVADVTAGRVEPRSDVLFAIWRRFKAEGIKIPCPQREVYLHAASGGLSSPETLPETASPPSSRKKSPARDTQK